MGQLSRTNAIKQPLSSFPEWTSTHGIPQVGRSRKLYCMGFWAIITLIAAALLIWQTVLLILQYYHYDVSVQIELKFEQRAFPAVTVCNLNPYRKSVVYNFPKVKRLMDTYEYTMKSISCGADPTCYMATNATLEQYRTMYGFQGIYDTAALQTRAKNILGLEIAGYNITDAVDKIGDFIQGCSFNTQDCDMTNDWETYIDPKMGSCFAFNTNATHMAQRAGPIYGLRVVLKTNISEFLATSDAAGMRVIVYDQGEKPFPDIFGYNVQTGSSSSIGVTFVDMSRLAEPYGQCTDDKPDNYLYDLAYSTEGCQRSIYQQEMIDNCNCYDPSYPIPAGSNATVCVIPDDFACWARLTNLSSSDNSCTQPCNEGVYEVTVSSAKWPSGSVTQVGNCIEGEYDESCLTVFKVFF
uniref:Uncharacterized protein n=1 Tax=Acrobeloides nanus TaxID=290746 RepID=A0A914CZK6_9BILA